MAQKELHKTLPNNDELKKSKSLPSNEELSQDFCLPTCVPGIIYKAQSVFGFLLLYIMKMPLDFFSFFFSTTPILQQKRKKNIK